MFEDLRREFATLADDKGLALEVAPCDDSVHSDPSLVGQILRNLLSNAIKYTSSGRVALRCAHDQPSSARIEVLDMGIGIPTEQLRYIYDEFYQVGVPANTLPAGDGPARTVRRGDPRVTQREMRASARIGLDV